MTKKDELGVGMAVCSHEEVISAGMDPRLKRCHIWCGCGGFWWRFYWVILVVVVLVVVVIVVVVDVVVSPT
jgi:hypothetical protein